MKYLVIGNGYVGRRVIALLAKSGRPYIVADRTSDIEAIMASSFTPRVVFNCAGYTGVPNVDACETEKEKTLRDNLLLPQRLVRVCERWSAILVHVSSGCLYQGGPWTEEDPPNFSGSFYSLSKILAEDTVRTWARHYTFRIRMPFSGANEPKNLLIKLKNYPRLINYTNSLSHIDDAVKAMIALVYNQAPFGTYNVVNPGIISTEEIARMMKLKPEWVSREEFSHMIVAPRSECTLSTAKLEQFVDIRPVYDALRKSIKEMKEDL